MERKDSVRSIMVPAAPDVVFVGAGPVGLWTAVQIKILCPWASILMLEKYAEYQRKHVLLLDKASLHGIPDHGNLKVRR